jgi:tetratricopeptide (TPR) repeat protein
MLEIMARLENGEHRAAVRAATNWRDEAPGDVVALIALGEALEAVGKPRAAARVYGSLIDLFPARADLRRYAGQRLERLGDVGLALAIDTYREAVEQRPDHPNSHRLYAYALVRAGRAREAFDAIVAGAERTYPGGRFAGVDRILRDDVGLVAAAWIAAEPALASTIAERVKAAGAVVPSKPSTRFVMTWETDANDVDFHIRDREGNHAYYGEKTLASGGALYADVTTGYGPECFTIEGEPSAYPYRFDAKYFSRGPMGYGMGRLQIVEHDGKGGLRFDDRPFIIMQDHASVELGSLQQSLASNR